MVNTYVGTELHKNGRGRFHDISFQNYPENIV